MGPHGETEKISDPGGFGVFKIYQSSHLKYIPAARTLFFIKKNVLFLG